VVAVCFQVGYVINGHVLRPARVVVSQWNGA
jgi:molecular chaperone GrpE